MNKYSKLNEILFGRTSSVLSLQVVFGTPSSACAGSGVCKMLPLQTPSNALISCARFNADCWVTSNKVILRLNRYQFSAKEWQRWFGRGVFLVEEDFLLPLWVTHSLGIERRSINAGSYLIGQDHECLIIRLVSSYLEAAPVLD